MKAGILVCVASIAAASAICSCSTAPSDARITLVEPFSSDEAFGPVGDFLDHRCGSLDCHGNTSRNLKIWGCEGMRWLPTDAPICSRLGGSHTTHLEYQATFRSLVGLEPTAMSAVVLDHGMDPELLTFVRKARGQEAHKGGKLITQGDDQDKCITSWLAGTTDTAACGNAISNPNFPAIPSNP